MLRLDEKGAPGGKRLAELADFVRTMELAGPEPVLPTVVDQLPELIGSEQSLAYLVDETGDLPRLEFFHARGISDPGGARLARLVDATGKSFGAHNLFRPEQWNVAITLGRDVETDWFAQRPIVREVFPHWGVTGRDQARVLVAEGDTLLTWIGGYRAEPFTPRECAVLEAIAPMLAPRLVLERRLAEGQMASRALDLALEAIATGAFVVDGRGAIRHANLIGRRQVDGDAAAMRLRIVAALRGEDAAFEVTRIAAAGLGPHYLLVERRPAGDPGPRLAVAAARWELTRRQRDVLALVVQGHPNKTIAERLALSASTVELHVSAILQKACVESRAGLASKFWTEL